MICESEQCEEKQEHGEKYCKRHLESCPECDGQGIIFVSSRWSSDGLREIPCPECTPDYEPNYEDRD